MWATDDRIKMVHSNGDVIFGRIDFSFGKFTFTPENRPGEAKFLHVYEKVGYTFERA